MGDQSVELGKLEIGGVVSFTVRVVENGRLSTKVHCDSWHEAHTIANMEAERLGVPIQWTGFHMPQARI